jgi:hypothetical protein
MKRLCLVLLLVGTLPLAGCVVAPVGPAPHAGLHWVPGHYGAYGGWHPGHWA